MVKKLSLKEKIAKENYELNQKRLASEEKRWNNSNKTSTERNIMSASIKDKKEK
jgi:hypothetical protein